MSTVQPQPDLDRFDGLRLVLVPLLTLVAAAFMLYGALFPFSGQFPGFNIRFVTLIAVAVAIGSQVVPRGSRLALMLTWAAIGSALIMGTIGLFSIGMFYLAAFVLLIFALIASPNRSGLESRGDWRLLIAFFAGYLVTFYFVAMLA